MLRNSTSPLPFPVVVLQWKRNSSRRVVITHDVSNYFVNWTPFSLRRTPCWCWEALSSRSFLTHLPWRARWPIIHYTQKQLIKLHSIVVEVEMIAKIFSIPISSNNPHRWAEQCTINAWQTEKLPVIPCGGSVSVYLFTALIEAQSDILPAIRGRCWSWKGSSRSGTWCLT